VHVRVISDGPPAVLVATTATARMRITLARARHVPAGAFRTARGKPAQIVQELHPGAHPSQAVAAYWLGPDWNGHAATSSSVESGRAGYYAIGYPHLSVLVTSSTPGFAGDERVTLGDGTNATLQEPDGSFTLSGGSSHGATSVNGVMMFGSSGSPPGGTMAFVFLPHAMVVLSGSAVTRRSAPAIVRSLRPL
jgi:hypothetical protein